MSNFFGDFVPNVMEFFSRMRQPPSKVIAGYQLKAGREGKREIRREVSVSGVAYRNLETGNTVELLQCC